MENHPPSPAQRYVAFLPTAPFPSGFCSASNFVPSLVLAHVVYTPCFVVVHTAVVLLTLTSRVSNHSATANPPTESSFSFTPIKALSALPRLWDRKPSTPVRAGDKSRKLWKRIRFPFGGMKTETETQSTAITGIGAAKNSTSDYQRGVKRRCVDPSDADQETELEQRGRSFLETKWEMQASRKKRE